MCMCIHTRVPSTRMEVTGQPSGVSLPSAFMWVWRTRLRSPGFKSSELSHRRSQPPSLTGVTYRNRDNLDHRRKISSGRGGAPRASGSLVHAPSPHKGGRQSRVGPLTAADFKTAMARSCPEDSTLSSMSGPDGMFCVYLSISDQCEPKAEPGTQGHPTPALGNAEPQKQYQIIADQLMGLQPSEAES